MRTYLDHNASSPLRPSARAAMLAAMEMGGNASSIHREGRQAHKLLDDARESLAGALGCIAPMIIFTSGGSEANNLAIKGSNAERLLVSAIEHPSVLAAARASGKPVEVIPVTPQGLIDLEALARLLPGPKSLISLMLANNETGVIQPVQQVVAMSQPHGALVHCDAVQAFGKIPVNFGLLGTDMLTITAHKLGGPQGIGALVVRDGLPITSLIHGGGQELRRRAGTENLAAIAGFAAVATEKTKDLSALRDRLESSLEAVEVFGKPVPRLPNTTCLALPGSKAESLLIELDLEGFAVSSGSACSSGKVAASHVLAAMGVSPELARGALRISLGWNTTEEDIDRFTAAWQRILARRSTKAA